MKKLLKISILALPAIFLAMLLWQPAANARPPEQSGPPSIPHTLDGRSDCVSCHATGANGAPQYPANHQGRTSDMCQVCHKPASAGTAPRSNSGQGSTTQVPGTPAANAGGPPQIPHTLEGRDNCLACHQAGLGGAPKLPSSHAGRTVDTCRGCHQPAQAGQGEAPLTVATPISHPKGSSDQSTCVTCHLSYGGKDAQLVKDWQSSIHAQRRVGCADCHGGDPTSMDRAMTLDAGFVGAPNKVDIPALCASCHSNVEQMRQYDLPTDQWSKYQESIHGKKLAQWDPNVPTCFTCHDGHGTKAVQDQSAKVYPMNVPALCSSCHSNVELMKPYGIPTNQNELYQKSVHGVALLQKQDMRAPTCATCHGTHGAAPPGFSEVANVCGSCHTATQDYYLASPHAKNEPGTPKCVTCHGRYDVMQPSEAMFHGSDARECGSCHAGSSAQTEVVQSIEKSLTGAATAVDKADAAVRKAASNALIVAPEELKLAQARTDLISARAAQHTLDLTIVKEKTEKATTEANQVIADAEKANSDSLFRREFMGFGLGIMALAIGSLYVVRRELYKQLPKE